MVQKIITHPGLPLSIRSERYVFTGIGQGHTKRPYGRPCPNPRKNRGSSLTIGKSDVYVKPPRTKIRPESVKFQYFESLHMKKQRMQNYFFIYNLFISVLLSTFVIDFNYNGQLMYGKTKSVTTLYSTMLST